jgi:hypothetical protein
MVTSRIWFTAAQKAELWERWKNGQSAAARSVRGRASGLASAGAPGYQRAVLLATLTEAGLGNVWPLARRGAPRGVGSRFPGR